MNTKPNLYSLASNGIKIPRAGIACVYELRNNMLREVGQYATVLRVVKVAHKQDERLV